MRPTRGRPPQENSSEKRRRAEVAHGYRFREAAGIDVKERRQEIRAIAGLSLVDEPLQSNSSGPFQEIR